MPDIFLRFKQDEETIRQLIHQAKETAGKHYVDYGKILMMLDRIIHRDHQSKDRINPQALQSSLMLLIYQLESSS